MAPEGWKFAVENSEFVQRNDREKWQRRMTHRNHSTARSSPTASDGIVIAVSRMIIVTIPALGTDGTANVDKAVRILKKNMNPPTFALYKCN